MSISADELQAELDRLGASKVAEEKRAADESSTHLPASYSKFLEPLATTVTGSLADIPAGYIGLGTALMSGADAGVDALRSVQDALTYRPRTPYGEEGIEALSSAFEPVADVVEGVRRRSGDLAYSAFGDSPLAGSLGTVGPEALLEFAGLGALRRVAPRAQFFDAKGNPTDDLYAGLRELGIEYENLSPEAQALIPPRSTAQIGGDASAARTALVPVAAEQVKTGGEGSLAGFKPEVRRGIGSDSLLPYPAAQKASDLMNDPGLIQLIKTASPETRASMLRMIDIRRRTADNKRAAQAERTTDVSGAAAVDRIDYLADIANTNRQRLDEISRSELAGKQVDVVPIADAYSSVLEKANIEIDPETGAFNYENSIFKPVPQAQFILDQMNEVLKKDTVDAADFHIIKRQLDELIRATKGKPGATGTAGGILSRMRSEVNSAIRQVNPEYAAINDELAQTLSVFDELENATSGSVDILEATADQKIGQDLRKLFSNYSTRVDMSEAIRQLEDVARAQGATFETSAGDLAELANSLNRRIGAEAQGSLQAIMQNANRPDLVSEYTAEVVTDAVSGTPGAGGIIKRLIGRNSDVSNAEVLDALEALIKDLGTGE